jgi:hypothetical protein
MVSGDIFSTSGAYFIKEMFCGYQRPIYNIDLVVQVSQNNTILTADSSTIQPMLVPDKITRHAVDTTGAHLFHAITNDCGDPRVGAS